MTKILDTLKKILIFLKNVPMILQLGLIILALVVALYWLLDLLGNSSMSFMQPFATGIIKFVHSFYHQQAQVGMQMIDGSLLLFVLLLFVIVFMIGKLNWLLDEGIDYIDKMSVSAKRHQEVMMNRKLEQDVQKEITKFNNFAVAIEFEVQDCMVNNFWGGDKDAGVQERRDRIYNTLNESFALLNNVKIVKNDNSIFLLVKDFQTIDRILMIVSGELDKLKKLMMKERWLMNWYVALAIYKEENMQEIYADLQKLMSLHLKNEIICFGNFNLRYNQISPLSRKFEIERRGSYSMDNGEIAVWRLIKKI